MVDIPEHLLKRSRDAKAQAGTEPASEPDADDTDTADAPEPEAAEAAAPAGAVEPAAVEPEVTTPGGVELEPVATAAPARPEPARAYAPASQPTGLHHGYRGAHVPGWLVPVYILVPILIIALGMSIVNAVEEEEGAAEAAGPDAEAIYAKNCASCHGPDGGGGVGPALAAVGDVFPDFKAMYDWVATVAAETDGPYGEGGAGNNGAGATSGRMPAFTSTLSEAEIYAVVAHEREKFGGMDPSTFPPATDFGGESTESAGAE